MHGTSSRFGMIGTECGCITGCCSCGRTSALQVSIPCLSVQSEAHRLAPSAAQAHCKGIGQAATAAIVNSVPDKEKHNASGLHEATAEAMPCAAMQYVPKTFEPTSFLTFLKGLKFLLAFCFGGSKRMEGSLSGCGAPILSSQRAGCCCRRLTECAALLVVTGWLHVAS